MRTTLLLFSVLIVVAAVTACNGSEPKEPTLFERVPAERTGISFTNTLAEDTTLNILNYLYYYNGGGVAVGDVNNDDLPDLYFTANEGPNALYINRGNLRFEEVTEQAGVAGTGDWTTGVTMTDVNADGWLDLYVSVVNGYQGLSGTNQLYINNGDGTFTERAAAYGLDRQSYATQAAFFDYDGDGDLDVYLLNHSVHKEETYGRSSLRQERDPEAGDKLLRNENGQFVDVSEEAGIIGGVVGYGLGVAVSDLDVDGCPDIYVANDFHENDYLYYNRCDGTFTESIASATGHNSLSSMGTDAADFNNDRRPDVAVLDMLPDRESVRQTAVSSERPDVYRLKRTFGYHHQLMRNTLQLNQGRRRFSEIGLLAGIHATDWSWAPLFADLDNDGWKDLFVTNGIYRRPNDLDYIDYASQKSVQSSLAQGVSTEDLSQLDRMPQVPVPNYAFRNEGNLTFSDRKTEWGLDREGFSNGAAYADLDNDGDLDLITNNIDAPASIYENRTDTLTHHHYLTVTLEGSGGNTLGIGAKVMLVQGDQRQLLEQMPTRGYQSSVDPRLHFGLGTSATIDSLTVIWPDKRYQVLTGVAADQTITLRQAEARGRYRYPSNTSSDPLFADVTDAVELDYRHEENSFSDFNREYLMPHELSKEGPALAVGDVNGDGLDDVYAGGGKWQPGRLLVQQSDGRFVATNEAVWKADNVHEDVDAAFFDANGDGAQDLYVVSGGNEFWGTADALRDRLYLNDGRGRFQRAKGALPDSMYANGACVTPGDFDADGDVDLFVGSRVVSRTYGVTPESYLLDNDGKGTFRTVTDERAEGLAHVGMVTDAAWTDTNGDGALDLVVVGEWMPVTVFVQQKGRFVERTDSAGLAKTNGWWNAVHASDMDGDGDADLVLGNLGLNSRLKARPDAPVRLYLNDFDGNGSLDPILTYYRNGTSYPLASRDALIQQMPSLAERFPTYHAFGARTIDEIVPPDKLDEAAVKTAYTLATSYAENNGDGTFAIRSLPLRAQFAPVYGILVRDFDRDGAKDVMLGGNFYGVKPNQGRYDASYGLFLQGGDSMWTAVAPPESNLYLEGQVRALRMLHGADGARLVLVARNNDRLQVVRVRSAFSRQPSAVSEMR